MMLNMSQWLPVDGQYNKVAPKACSLSKDPVTRSKVLYQNAEFLGKGVLLRKGNK